MKHYSDHDLAVRDYGEELCKVVMHALANNPCHGAHNFQWANDRLAALRRRLATLQAEKHKPKPERNA